MEAPLDSAANLNKEFSMKIGFVGYCTSFALLLAGCSPGKSSDSVILSDLNDNGIVGIGCYSHFHFDGGVAHSFFWRQFRSPAHC